MAAFTEAQLKRIRDVRMALMLGHGGGSGSLGLLTDLVSLKPPLCTSDLKLLLDRLDALSDDLPSCADEMISRARDRVEEDLRRQREFLAHSLEQVRTAELMVREAERALAALQALTDGGLYEHGGEINARWDAMAALYASQGLLPVPEAVEKPPAPEPAQEPTAEAAEAPAVEEPLPEPVPPPAAAAPPEPPRETRWEAKAAPRPPMAAAERDEAVFAALKVSAGEQPQVQVSTAVLAAASGVPNGSILTVLRRLEAEGRIEIIPDKPETGAPRPNIYRFVVEAAEEAAEKLAGAWGAKVKPKPSGLVPQSAALRDRITDTLRRAACTTSGLASMLDVKELSVCQTLEAMKHEGVVAPDEMPEAGRRAQLWRLQEAA